MEGLIPEVVVVMGMKKSVNDDEGEMCKLIWLSRVREKKGEMEELPEIIVSVF